MCSKQFPSALFLISILRAGDAWAGYGAVALPCGDGTYVIVESCISAGRDSAGFHTLVDRKKDMFISGGENIYPAEIEAAVAGHPQVAECAVIGVPDTRWGEVGHLVLVAVAGHMLDTKSVLARIESRLARYKLPKHVTVLEALPRNGAGKVVKAELRRLLDMA